MKKILVSLLVAGFFVAGAASAHMGMMGGYWQNGGVFGVSSSAEISAALQDILREQNISDQKALDCSEVTDSQFEKLGDAYMGVMLPNEQQHEAMDNIMGGEGSASLRQAHINMGRSYLGCWANYNSGPVTMPMMGVYDFSQGSPVGGNFSGFGSYGMTGGYFGGYNWLGWITMILAWVLLVLGIAAIVKWLRK